MIPDPILVIDDASDVPSVVTRVLSQNGYSVERVENRRQAMEKFRLGSFSMVIAGARLPESSGLEVLAEIRQLCPLTPVIMATANGSVNHAVEAMQAGASDYLLKPFSAEALSAAVEKAIGEVRRQCRQETGHRADEGGCGHKQLITRNPRMLQVLALAKNVARSRATVLIQGESGTGKEVLARFIHQHSRRRHRPFVAINCAALPETLAESELFGHEKGAFTGAFSRKVGKFELAQEGTLLLDEISELSLPLQAKLLRVLQEQEVDRIGGTQPIPVDVRVIAVTNVDLKKAVSEGKFRGDLFYRVNVVPLTVPPLGQRRDDIPVLTEFFLEKFSMQNRRPRPSLHPKTLDALMAHDWKGNVRELENTIERAVLLTDGDILQEEYLMLDPKEPPLEGTVAIRAGMSVREMEKRLIIHTLKEVDDNRTQAAELLGVSIRTLRNKLKEYRETNRIPAR